MLLSNHFLDFLLLLELLQVLSIHLEVLVVFFFVGPFELIHHAFMFIADHSQT